MLPAFRPTFLILLVHLAGAAWLAAPAVAQPSAVALADTTGPAWGSLSASQRRALAPLQGDWAGIDASRKAKWLEVAAKFPAMPADERSRVQARMAAWARLSPNERGQARLTFQESKQLSREEKQQRWEAYQALPDDKRRELAERAKPAAADARRPARSAAPIDAALPKRTAVAPANAASKALVKPVAPTIVQAKPGATTTLMTKQAAPPAHQQPGQPKIAAQPDQVNRKTLLPRSGPQATASASAPRLP